MKLIGLITVILTAIIAILALLPAQQGVFRNETFPLTAIEKIVKESAERFAQ